MNGKLLIQTIYRKYNFISKITIQNIRKKLLQIINKNYRIIWLSFFFQFRSNSDLCTLQKIQRKLNTKFTKKEFPQHRFDKLFFMIFFSQNHLKRMQKINHKNQSKKKVMIGGLFPP